MPALAPEPPRVFKRILELAGYECVAEDTHCWILVSGAHPAVVPKHGELIAMEIMHSTLHAARIDNETYFRFLAQAKTDCGL